MTDTCDDEPELDEPHLDLLLWEQRDSGGIDFDDLDEELHR